jgi:hypothetical protein
MEVLLEHGCTSALLFMNVLVHIFLKGAPIKKPLQKPLVTASAMNSDRAFEHLSTECGSFSCNIPLWRTENLII